MQGSDRQGFSRILGHCCNALPYGEPMLLPSRVPNLSTEITALEATGNRVSLHHVR